MYISKQKQTHRFRKQTTVISEEREVEEGWVWATGLRDTNNFV